MSELDPMKRWLTWTVYATPPYYRLGPVHTCLYVRACRLVTGTSSGRAASGGALPPLLSTRITPESIRNFPKNLPFFRKSDFSLWICGYVDVGSVGKKEVLEKFCMDSGVLRVARGCSRAKAPPLAAPSPLEWARAEAGGADRWVL